MEKHAYLNMIYNKNDTERCTKLTFVWMMEISEIRLS